MSGVTLSPTIVRGWPANSDEVLGVEQVTRGADTTEYSKGASKC